MEQEQKGKSKPVRFHQVLDFMEIIVKNHENDTVRFGASKKRNLHHFFHKEDYKHNPLEQLFYSEDIFTKKGCKEFIIILNSFQKHGVKKMKSIPLDIKAKKQIGKEMQELERLLKEFEKNPDTLSPYLRDRYVALSFKESIK